MVASEAQVDQTTGAGGGAAGGTFPAVADGDELPVEPVELVDARPHPAPRTMRTVRPTPATIRALGVVWGPARGIEANVAVALAHMRAGVAPSH